jgi:hypothetical protein
VLNLSYEFKRRTVLTHTAKANAREIKMNTNFDIAC